MWYSGGDECYVVGQHLVDVVLEIKPRIAVQNQRGLGVSDLADAIDVIVDYTEGDPYFIQEYGKIVWDIAPEGEPISQSVTEEAQRAVEAKLAESFFRVRAQRTTERELHYLHLHNQPRPRNFTVPQFDRYMRRNHDFAPPGPRR